MSQNPNSKYPGNQPRIFKYTFGHIDRGQLAAKINYPINRILDIQEQGYILTLWAEVDAAWLGYDDYFVIYCAWTGDPPPGEGWSYFKTIQSEVDGLVYHLYLKNKL